MGDRPRLRGAGRRSLVVLAFTLAIAGPAHAAVQQDDLAAVRRNLMPVPSIVDDRDGEPLAIGRDFAVSVAGPPNGIEPRIERAVLRMLRRLALQTGIPLRIRIEPDRRRARMHVWYRQAVPELQEAVEDETYQLTVQASGAELEAPTPYGVLRGLETFLQLVQLTAPALDAASASQRAAIGELDPEPADFVVPAVWVGDGPRFPWRGLLLDPGRHFLSLDTIKRNLDAMAAVKLNVLHWHLSEDQGFRVESKVFPKLHELGSDGQYYTQEEVREIIDYARDRGIRVMPEFDMPGHSTSWFVGYPELASAPGPYEIIDTWGIQDPAMDPTRGETYRFLQAFIAEMAALFPDRYFHIGGDEVNGRQWNANADIQQFILDNDLVDNHGLQTYFNRRLQPFLAERGKIMMGWDEIFQPGLPQNAVVHSWRGPDGIAAAARAGYRTVLSNGYYIDLSRPASHHYAVDPLGGPAADLTADQRELVLGGEATMWGEYVVDETIDSRIWPRTAAIAERLWSAADVVEIGDMYRRLETTSRWLEFTGVTHRSGYEPMLARLIGAAAVEPLRMLADVVEPLKGYRRGRTRPYTRFTPLTRLVDAARPESDTARHFAASVRSYVESVESGRGAGDDGGATIGAVELRRRLSAWRDNDEKLMAAARESPMLSEVGALSANLRLLAEAGLEALEDIERGRRPPPAVHAARRALLETAAVPHGALQIMIVEPVGALVDAAGAVGR